MSNKNLIVENLPNEEWRPMNGSENYFISNFGRYKKRNKNNERLLKVHIDDKGYQRIHFDGKSIRLHRAVAEAFIPNPNNYPFVDILDNNRNNIHVDNLAWVTREQDQKNYKELKNSHKI